MALSEESAEVEVLFANMDKLKDLTKKIQGSLTRLDISGQNVQAAVRPVHGDTGKLQVTNTNIDKILQSITKIREPLNMRNREDPIIRGGLRNTPLPEYLASMNRTQQALAHLQNTNLRSNQQAAAEMKKLLGIGSKTLTDTFQETIREQSQPVEPLHYITKNIPFPTFSDQSAETLRMINSQAERDPKAASRYIEVRSPYISATLQTLAMASIGTTKKQNPTALYSHGSCAICTYSPALEHMVLAEFQNVSRIFPREQWTSIHTQTCQNSIDEFTRTLRELNTFVKANIATDCYLAFEIIGILSSLVSRLEACNPDLKQPIDEALRPIRDTAKQALPRLIEDTRNSVRNLISLPANGAIPPITDSILTRLTHLIIYLPALCSVLASVGENGWRSPQVGVPTISAASGEELFGKYAADMLEALVSSLETRAPVVLKNRATQGILLANTVSIINSSINTSELSRLVPATELQRLQQWRKKGIAMYIDAWADPARELRDVIHTNRTSQGGSRQSSGSHGPMDSAAYTKGMSSKDKDTIRSNFQKFTAMFDELLAKHRTYSIEPDVKPDIALGVEKLIEPLYARYWQRYHELDKGKGKYIKYDAGEITAAIRKSMQ